MPRFLGPTSVGSELAWRVCLDTWFSGSLGLCVEGGSAQAIWVPSSAGVTLGVRGMHPPVGPALTVHLPVGTAGIQSFE